MAGLNLHPHPGKCPAPWSPPPVPPGSWGGRPGKNYSAYSWAFSAGTRHLPFPRRVHGSAGRRSSESGEIPGPGAEASPEDPAERAARLGCFPWCQCPSRAHASAEIGATGAIPPPGALRLQVRLGFLKSGQEKNKPAPHPLRRPSSSSNPFLGKRPCPTPMGPGSFPSSSICTARALRAASEPGAVGRTEISASGRRVEALGIPFGLREESGCPRTHTRAGAQQPRPQEPRVFRRAGAWRGGAQKLGPPSSRS